MKTITFYSYKGGVGRSLTLSNIATRLSQLNKKVFIIDFDLDAPGLQFKFKEFTHKDVKTGIVDYIYEFSNNGNIPNKVADFTSDLIPNNENYQPISFLSAGDIEENDYWKKLSMIKWADMFYSEKAQGIRFFLDLKSKIEKEYNPDFLLVDSRTGITDISGITLRIFADEIVVLAANNEENIFGSKRIIKSLINQKSTFFKRIPKVNFVLTRLPFTDTAQDKQKEFILIESTKDIFKTYLNLDDFEVSVIHSDRRLEEQESQLIGYKHDEEAASISNDYLKLFDLLTSDVLSTEEIQKFENLRQSESEFSKALKERDLAKKLPHLNKAIQLNSKEFSFYKIKGDVLWNLKSFDEALENYYEALKLNPFEDGLFFSISMLHIHFKQLDKALEFIRKIKKTTPLSILWEGLILLKKNNIEEAKKTFDTGLIKHPISDELLNARADLLRFIGKYDEALLDIYKAIELSPENPIYFATLAEIHAGKGNNEDFYLNLAIALSKGITAENMRETVDVYKKFKFDERFKSLLLRYDVKFDEIFDNL